MLAHLTITTDGQRREHSLEEHLEQVSRYAKELGESIDLANTMELLGLLHDVGKCSLAYQKYLEAAQVGVEGGRRGQVNHSSAGAALLEKLLRKGADRLAADWLEYPLMAHHGLFDCIAFGNDNITRRCSADVEIDDQWIEKTETLKEHRIRALLDQSLQELNKMVDRIEEIAREETAGNMVEVTGSRCFYFQTGLLTRLLLSMLIDADWRDTGEFFEAGTEERITRERRQEIWEKFRKRLFEKLKSFSADTELAKIRRAISNDCRDFVDKGPGIYELSIPTGGGKTFSGIRYALEYACLYQAEHVYYIAPFLSILEQNAQVIRQTLQGDDLESAILEHHSNIVVEEDELDMEMRQLFSTWDSPLILTTMVQFFNTIFSGKQSVIRRFHQLKNSVIILDEVQSIPSGFTHMFISAMNFLAKVCGSTVIMCTATQPNYQRLGHQLIFGQPQSMTDTSSYTVFNRTTIHPCLGAEMDIETFRDFVSKILHQNLLIVLNTKQAVRAVAERLKEDLGEEYEVIQLTTYMCAEERLELIQYLKDSIPDKKLICVSTNLIEAGVDISFEAAVRSLAGLDSIIQTAGRVNRNGERKSGEVYVVRLCEDLENVRCLKELTAAQRALSKVLGNPFNKDLVEPYFQVEQLLKRYYTNFFAEMENNLDGKKDQPFYKWLSENEDGVEEYRIVKGEVYPHELAQKFQTVGKDFSYIDELNQVSVVVPYGKGCQYIERLKQAKGKLGLQKKLLKRLQRYTINLFRTDAILKELTARGMLRELLAGIFIVDERQYLPGFGISAEMEELIF